MPDFKFERAARKDGATLIAGVDEAGRGPLAGPVVAAAVLLDDRRLPRRLRDGLDDSKLLAQPQREKLYAAMLDSAAVRVAVGIATVEEIDGLNILRASLTAMARAVAGLPEAPDLTLVDGNQPPDLPCPSRCIVGGDGRCLSIAAASIVAKVTRDRMMVELDTVHPGYGWSHNAGYGTIEHVMALEYLGVTPHHRRSFAPVYKMLRVREGLTPIYGSTISV